MPNLDSVALREWASNVLRGWGFSGTDADYVATTLVDADLRGLASHGVMRLPAYEKRVAEGLIDPQATPEVRHELGAATAQIFANRSQGQLAGRAAVNTAADLAREFGVAAVTVSGSAHFGTAGFFARELASQGFVSLVVSNSEPIVVPFGGKEALLGTNPFAFAAPTGGSPLCLDMATSTSAMGKVFVARNEGTPIPDTWGVDGDGTPTTDPNLVQALLPAAGPKGFGLGMLVEILAGVLSGAAFTGAIGNMYNDFSKPQDVGHFFLALDITHFMPLMAFADRMQELVDQVHAVPPAPGFDSVLAPGEPEERTLEKKLQDGIDFPDATWEELQDLGQRWNETLPKEATE